MNPAIDQHLASRETARLDQLVEYLRIPSISAIPSYRADVERAADWTAAAIRDAGVPNVEVIPTAGWPIVLGEWRVDANAPTVLIYGHYDVQPPDPLDLWVTQPFEPTIREGKIYARGAADMKANYLAAIAAVAAYAATDGAPPVNLIFLCEGEEEIGSPNLPGFLKANRERLACDLALSADGLMYGPDSPSISAALKGLASCQIDLRTGSSDLHSGQFGAAVPNAPRALAQLIASLHDETGRVAVAGFYDDVLELTAADRAEIAAPPFDEERFQAMTGANALTGEAGYTTQELRWARPTLDINGLWGGFEGEGSKTVTPCEAHAKITCRLVPDQDPARILECIERHVATHLPAGAEAVVTRFDGMARPFSLPRDHPGLAAGLATLRERYGKEPLIVRSGGTVPATAMFQEALGVDTVTIAFMQPDARAHAPNEWHRVSDFHLAARVYALFLCKIGQMQR